MNIAFFLLPKNKVSFLCEDFTLRKAIGKMKHSGFTAMPVITKEGKYVGTINGGDFLFTIMENLSQKQAEPINSLLDNRCVKDVLQPNTNPPVYISATVEELLIRSMNQNFVPVVDDTGSFIGIVTRQDIIRYFYNDTLEKRDTAS